MLKEQESGAVLHSVGGQIYPTDINKLEKMSERALMGEGWGQKCRLLLI